MSYRIIRPATHQEWLEERTKGIGSSEAGTIMGVNKFDTAYKLWRRKTGQDGPVPVNEAMELGHAMEDSVAQMFAARTGAYIRKSSQGDWIAADTRRDYLRVSPDRIYFEKGAKRSKSNQRILECKTSSTFIEACDVPAYWYCQIQYQMGIMGVRKGALAWICSQPRLHFDYLEVDFNPSFFKTLVDTIDSFWNVNVKGGVAPDAINAEDTLLRYPSATEGLTLEAPVEIIEKYEELKDIGARIKIFEETKTSLESDIKQAMGPSETLIMPDGTVIAQWKNTKESQRFNAKAFLAADPEGYTKYIETIPGGRRFTIK